MPKLDPNATLVERITYYVDTDRHEQAKALAKLGDYLEECFAWDVSFDAETP